ncbi:hypothetical protein BDW68DRAFT_182310 [Aspergillus falconensis]
MERNGWVGVCCEPNLVFVACNQFPIIAMRLNDARDGTKVADEIIQKYKAALEKKSMISQNDLLKDWVSVKQGYTATAKSVGFTAWAAAFMNTWNSEFVRAGFDNHARGWEIYSRHSMGKWRVVCVGDAVHPVSPYAAYGMAMAIEDGYYLAKSLEGSTYAIYEQLMLRFKSMRGSELITLTTTWSLLVFSAGFFHALPWPLAKLRHLVFDYTPILGKYLREWYLEKAEKETIGLKALQVS